MAEPAPRLSPALMLLLLVTLAVACVQFAVAAWPSMKDALLFLGRALG